MLYPSYIGHKLNQPQNGPIEHLYSKFVSHYKTTMMEFASSHQNGVETKETRKTKHGRMVLRDFHA